MMPLRSLLVAGLVVGIGACASPSSAPPAEAPAPAAPAEPTTVNPDMGLEAPAMPSPDTTDGKSAQAAANLVLAYYGAIAERDYARAYEMWGPSGPPDLTLEQFRQGFAATTNVRASVDEPRDQEGGAGSIYITVPVHVEAQTTDGADQRFEGNYYLRRVNDVDGAEPWQLRWRITDADLRQIR